MKEKQKNNFKNFEVLSETNNGTLVGGFSSIGGSLPLTSNLLEVKNKGCHVSNNCNGGNCARGCGVQ